MRVSVNVNGQEEILIQCPYCWEAISILVDCSVERQEYIEDCQVCCQPISLDVQVLEGDSPQVLVTRENN